MTAGITTGTQIGVASPTALPEDSRIVGYDKELRMKALPDDIYTKLSGVYEQDRKTIPDAIYCKVDPKATDGAVEANLMMKLKLRGGAVYGNDFAIGAEERPITRNLRIFCNNLRKVVDKPAYGRRQLESEKYKLYEQHIDDLADWNKEHHGVEIRQSVVEQFGETLPYGDTAADCVRNWNRHVFCCGHVSHLEAECAFDQVRATYSANIIAKILAAGGGSLVPTVSQTLNQPNLSHAQNFAIQHRISPLPIPGLPGGSGWIMTISELQAMYLGDPAWTTRNLGSLFKDVYRQNKAVQEWPGVIGSYKKFLIVEDVRQPTLLVTGSNDPYGLQALYMWMGDMDERQRENPQVVDTFFILGKAAVIDWTPQKLGHIKQDDDYGAIEGHGTRLVRGVQAPNFVNQAGTVVEQFSSVLGLCRLPDYV